MKDFLQKKVINPILGFLKQGVSSSQLAWAVSAGIVLATIPVFGVSTVLCMVIVWLFRLNPAAVLLTNQLAYPLQFLLYFPFLRTGEWLFNSQSVPLNITQLFSLFGTDFFRAIELVWWPTLYGVTVWTIISVPVAYCIFLLLKFIFTHVERNTETVQH